MRTLPDFTGFPPSIATSSGNILPSVLVFSLNKLGELSFIS
uniref:Uncharacterized protein n=1 Tax=Leptobrachium leishanense TaxID=445787 RepID=A0A8C5PBE8_9ANUR